MAKPAPLLPLAYCRIERAARLLCCEVEDILHWCSLGVIEGSVWLPGIPAYPVFVRDNEVVEDEDQYDELLDSLFHPDDAHGISPLPAFFGCNAKLIRRYGTLQSPKAFAHGLWSIGASQLESLLLGHQTYSSEWSLLPAGSDFRGDGVGIVLESSEDELPAEASQIWLIRRDLLLLKTHIDSGEPFSTDASTQTKREYHKPLQIPHHNTERHASTRASVLVAAIHARSRWPDKCLTYAAWADALWDHSHELFGGDEAPLSREYIQRLLSAAEGKNEVYKRS